MKDLLLDALAVYRLTRLVTTDSFPPVARLRENFVGRHTKERVEHEGGTHTHFAEPDAWAELSECAWCASWYVALGVISARALFPRAWDVAARALSFSAVAGLVSTAAGD